MKRMITAAAAAAGSLALLGGALVAGGAPALAGLPTNQAWGADATGTITLSPVALATPSFNPAVASNANIPGLLATSTITDRASTGGAEARINGPTVLTLPGNGSLLNLPANNSLTTSGLRSWCEVDGSDVFGGATIFSGAIMQIGYTTIALPAEARAEHGDHPAARRRHDHAQLPEHDRGRAHLRGDPGGAGRPDRRPRRVAVLPQRELTGAAGGGH